MGTPHFHKLSFGGPMARSGWVVEVGNLCPFCSQYYTLQYCQKQFVLILPVAKVILKPKVVHTAQGGYDYLCPLGGTTTYVVDCKWKKTLAFP